jgi:phytoene synthase
VQVEARVLGQDLPVEDVGGRVVHVLDLIDRMRERETFGRSAPS